MPSFSSSEFSAKFSLADPLIISPVLLEVENQEFTLTANHYSTKISVPVEIDDPIHVRMFSSAVRTAAENVVVIENFRNTNRSAHRCPRERGIHVGVSASLVDVLHGLVSDKLNRSCSISSVLVQTTHLCNAEAMSDGRLE